MTNSKEETVDLFEFKYLTTTNDKVIIVSETVQKESSLKCNYISPTIMMIITFFARLLPIIPLYIGCKYANECPIDWHIPYYLIIGGSIGIVMSILNYIKPLLELKLYTDTSSGIPRLAFHHTLLCIELILTILMFILTTWLILGCYEVLCIKNIVQYTERTQKNYCDPFLYRSSSWILSRSLIWRILTASLFYGKMLFDLRRLKKTKTSINITDL